jgi:hypothetical protein
MFQKAFLILSASAILGAGVVAPTATLAQFPGPPPLPGPVGPPSGLGGPPPGLSGPPPGHGGLPPQLGLGGPPRPPGPGGTAPRPLGAPSDFARVGGPSGFHGVDRAIQGGGRHFQGRTAGYEGGSRGYGYDRGGWARQWGRYGAHVYGSYGDGSDSYGYSDGSDSYAYADGCYYVYSQYAGRRVRVCSRD